MHVDNETWQLSIETVRKKIFDTGHSVVSKVVKNVIGAMSLVPTWVYSHVHP